MKSNNKIKILLGLVVLLVFANFCIWRFIFGLSSELKVIFFNVGQGDSIFVETPQGHQVLIDGGPDGGRVLEKLSKEMPFWDRTIDLLILTHPDSDHLKGLLGILDRYKVENILWTGVQRETEVFKRWIEAIRKEKANIVLAEKGQKIKAGEARFYVLHPFSSRAGELLEKGSNETSIVLKLLFGENAFLFTGDINRGVEKELLARSDLPAGIGTDVLKVAHHGGKNASSQEFLELAGAKVAVISCGKDNSYGHPHKEVLQALEEFGIKVLRTDEKGDVEISADGRDLIITN